MSTSPSAPRALGLAALLAACALPLPGTAHVQAQSPYPEPGPHLVGWRDEVMPFVGAQTIKNRIYYPATAEGFETPADPSGGPYTLVALIHGATAAPSYYDWISSHVASHGFVVASVGKMPALHETFDNLANETWELVQWTLAASADGGSPYAGLVVDGPRGVIGSSKGGAASELYVGLDPQVRAAALMEPKYIGTVAALANLAAWDGAWMSTLGELDLSVPGEGKLILAAATGSPRRAWVELQGAGHAGALDPDVVGLPVDPMPHDQQLALHMRVVLAFLQAELGGDEDRWVEIVGAELAGEPVVHASICPAPPLWAVGLAGAPSTVALGMAGVAGDVALLAVSPSAAAIPTAYGTLAIDPASMLVLVVTTLGAEGTLELVATVPPAASGLVAYVQGLATSGGGGALTRGDALVLP